MSTPPDETSAGREMPHARLFFDREPPPGYVREWTERLARPEDEVEPDLVSLLLFRIGPEWLALPTELLVEVTHAEPVHAVPSRTNATLRGLVNVRGQLRLCFSLHQLARVEEPEETSRPCSSDLASAARMVIIQVGHEQWVFLADEVFRVHRVLRAALRKPPSTLPTDASLAQAVFDWEGRTVGLLDGDRVMNALRSLVS